MRGKVEEKAEWRKIVSQIGILVRRFNSFPVIIYCSLYTENFNRHDKVEKNEKS